MYYIFFNQEKVRILLPFFNLFYIFQFILWIFENFVSFKPIINCPFYHYSPLKVDVVNMQTVSHFFVDA